MLYRIEINDRFVFIANYKFLEELKEAILEEIQEYNIPKSGLHPNTNKVVDEKVRWAMAN